MAWAFSTKNCTTWLKKKTSTTSFSLCLPFYIKVLWFFFFFFNFNIVYRGDSEYFSSEKRKKTFISKSVFGWRGRKGKGMMVVYRLITFVWIFSISLNRGKYGRGGISLILKLSILSLWYQFIFIFFNWTKKENIFQFTWSLISYYFLSSSF